MSIQVVVQVTCDGAECCEQVSFEAPERTVRGDYSAIAIEAHLRKCCGWEIEEAGDLCPRCVAKQT
jgi:hypothetical protein